MDTLQRQFNSYLEEITFIEGELLTIKSALRGFKEAHTSDSWRRLNEGTSTYRDIRISGKNLRLSEFGTEVNTHNLESTLKRIESRESLFALSQSYEVFEEYLKGILTSFFELFPEMSSKLGKYENLINQTDKMRTAINQMQGKDKNNKKLLWMVRKLSSEYENYERNNSSTISLNIWFDLTSDIRHSIVHNRFKLSNTFKSRLKENNKMKYFETAYTIDNQSTLVTDKLKVGRQISILNSMAYLILECLRNEKTMPNNG